MNRFQYVFCIISEEYNSRNWKFNVLLPLLLVSALRVPWLRNIKFYMAYCDYKYTNGFYSPIYKYSMYYNIIHFSV